MADQQDTFNTKASCDVSTPRGRDSVTQYCYTWFHWFCGFHVFSGFIGFITHSLIAPDVTAAVFVEKNNSEKVFWVFDSVNI